MRPFFRCHKNMYPKSVHTATYELVGSMAPMDNESFIQEQISHGKQEQALNSFIQLQCDSAFVNIHTLQALIKLCGKLKSLEGGHKIHAALTKTALDNDDYVGSTLVSMYGKCGQLAEAQHVFDQLMDRGVVLWTSLIDAYADHGQRVSALHCMERMELEKVSPNAVSFVCSLKACGRTEAIDHGLKLHSQVVKLGFEKDLIVRSALVDMYTKCGMHVEAHTVVDEIVSADAFLLTPLMAGYAKDGFGEKARYCWEKMQKEGVLLDAIALTCGLKACGFLMAITWGREIHTEIFKRGLESILSLSNTVVDMYARCGSFSEADKVFDNLSVRDVVSWNVLLSKYAESELCSHVIIRLEQMQQEGVPHTAVTYVCCLKSCETIGWGQGLHIEICKYGHERNTFVASVLVDMYARLGFIAEALTLFTGILEPNLVAWTALIAGYIGLNLEEEALQLLGMVVAQGIPVDPIVIACGLKACGKLRALASGQEIHARVTAEAYEGDHTIGTMLVDMYVTCGLLPDAVALLNHCRSSSAISWTSVANCLMENGCDEEALECLEMMETEAMHMDAAAFASSLKVCGAVGALERGQRLHMKITKEGFDVHTMVGNTIMDFYSKNGLLLEAQLVFDKMVGHTVVSWSALIRGYAIQGKSWEVFCLWERMNEKAAWPDDLTFLSILTVCSHMGLIEESLACFHEMGRSYNIVPTLKHFTTILDLFGRMGQLANVLVILDKMPFQQDLSVWLALLAACHKQGDVELGKCAFQGALPLGSPKDVESAFLLMWSMFAGAHMWDEIKVFEAMRTSLIGC